MDLKLRPVMDCKYDAVSLGEVMLRLDPGEGRIRCARSFKVWEGGGEYNVIRGLHKCFGMNTAVITSFADNEVGKLMDVGSWQSMKIHLRLKLIRTKASLIS